MNSTRILQKLPEPCRRRGITAWLIAFLASSSWALAGNPAGLVLLDALTGEQLLDFKDSEAACTPMVFAPGGRYLMTANTNHELLIWDSQTGGVAQTLATNITALAGPILMSASWAPDGLRILELRSSVFDRKLQAGTLFVRDAATGEVHVTLQDADHGIAGAAFSADGRFILTTGREHASLTWWDSTNGNRARMLVELWAGFGRIRSVTLAENSKPRGWWDADRGNRLTPESVEGQSLHEGYSDRSVMVPGEKLLLTIGSGGWAHMWDIESGETLWTASIASNFAVAGALQGRSSGLVFTPDGSGFFVPGFILSPAHPFWDARTAQEQLPKLKFEETRMVLMTSDTFPGRPLGYFPRSFTIRFSAAAFSPDGNRLLTWMDRPYGIPDVLRLWDLRTRTVLWKSKLTLVKAAAFSPDGARIAVIPDNLWGYPSR